jgi:uncharacterized protein
MGKFVIKTSSNGKYRFNLKADNGQVTLSSEGYTTKANCQNGIESVKSNAPTDSRYDNITTKNGKFYFNLKATNGQITGTSEMYDSETE